MNTNRDSKATEGKVTLLEHPQGVTDCPGFLASAVACDIRENGDRKRLDLALITSRTPIRAAGVFTLNDLCAAPVEICKATLKQTGGGVGGVVINSGNANAATGPEGLENARSMIDRAERFSDADLPFLVCSTGRIGRQLPMPQILAGIEAAVDRLSSKRESSLAVADAILTSDTRRKVATARFVHEGKAITVAGFAKGAGMIEPNMATMLAFLTTDVEAGNARLNQALKAAVDKTFNRISIDGDMSTNDTVLLLANGHSEVSLGRNKALDACFDEAVLMVCDALAELIVGDGEKVTKLVELIISGCRHDDDAEKVARAVGNSLLVKTSWYGSDPNWGRVADAAGYARVGLRESLLDITYDDTPALIKGVPQNENTERWKAIVAKKRFRISINLNQGDGQFRLLTSDLSEAYVDFNKSE